MIKISCFCVQSTLYMVVLWPTQFWFPDLCMKGLQWTWKYFSGLFLIHTCNYLVVYTSLDMYLLTICKLCVETSMLLLWFWCQCLNAKLLEHFLIWVLVMAVLHSIFMLSYHHAKIWVFISFVTINSNTFLKITLRQHRVKNVHCRGTNKSFCKFQLSLSLLL